MAVVRGEYTIVLVIVALLGWSGMDALGGAMHRAIGTNGSAAGVVPVSSAQAGMAREVAAWASLSFDRARAATRGGWERFAGGVRRWVGTTSWEGTLRGARATVLTADEGALRVHLFVPEGATAPVPTVLAMPGVGAAAKNFHTIPQALVDRGVAVAILDISNRWTLRLATRVRHGRRALAMLSERADVDSSRLGLLGHSLGGSTALVLSGDEGVCGAVALSPGYAPSPRGAWASLRSGKLPRGNALASEALQRSHAPRLVVGASLDHLVPARAYAAPAAHACTASGHCRYELLARAGHGNFSDMHVPTPQVWWPTTRDLLRTRPLDLTSLSPRAQTGAAQRRAAGALASDFLAPLLTASN